MFNLYGKLCVVQACIISCLTVTLSFGVDLTPTLNDLGVIPFMLIWAFGLLLFIGTSMDSFFEFVCGFMKVTPVFGLFLYIIFVILSGVLITVNGTILVFSFMLSIVNSAMWIVNHGYRKGSKT